MTFLASCSFASTSVNDSFAGSAGFSSTTSFTAGAETVVFPVRMVISLRFIALHISCVRIRPDAPTIPPITTNSGSLMAMPAMPPATPDRAFRREMVIGISAPPTRITKTTPITSDNTATKAAHAPLWTVCSTIPAAHKAARMPIITACPGSVLGLASRIRASLPAATRLPVSVSPPTASARPAVAASKTDAAPITAVTAATSADAPPPRPLSKAMIWGMEIIFAFSAPKIPAAVPAASAIHKQIITEDSVAPARVIQISAMAMTMAAAERPLPSTEVWTLLIMLMPRRTAATQTPQRM